MGGQRGGRQRSGRTDQLRWGGGGGGAAVVAKQRADQGEQCPDCSHSGSISACVVLTSINHPDSQRENSFIRRVWGQVMLRREKERAGGREMKVSSQHHSTTAPQHHCSPLESSI